MPIVLKLHATNKSTEDEFYRWLVGGVILITVVDRIFHEGILCNSMAAILLVMSLESCSKANASADVIQEKNHLYVSFLMTMSSKFFTAEGYRVTRVPP